MSSTASAMVQKHEEDVLRTPASQKVAIQTFWRATNCAAKRDMAGTWTLLRQGDWSDGSKSVVADYLKKHRSCLPNGSKARFQADSFRRALAAGYLVEKYKKQPVADYSALPVTYTQDALNALDETSGQADFLLRSFADCIVRNRTELSFKLLSSKPSSQSEADVFVEMQPIMGTCLPVNQGEQAKFTKTSLRGLMTEAAYDLELRYVENSTENSEATN